MNTWEIILEIALVLSVALVLGGLFERIRQNAVTGYLLAGLLLGPAGTGWISNVEHIRLLAELGVALLLFTIGLEFSLSRLRGSGRMAIFGGTIQIVLTGVVGGSAVAASGLSAVEAIVIGAALSLSSTAVVLRVLADRTELRVTTQCASRRISSSSRAISSTVRLAGHRGRLESDLREPGRLRQ